MRDAVHVVIRAPGAAAFTTGRWTVPMVVFMLILEYPMPVGCLS
jgi:hypothetical protein